MRRKGAERRVWARLLGRLCAASGFQVVPCGFPIQRQSIWQTILHLLSDIREPVVLDGGAHYGETVDQLLRILPSATVHSFEPNPRAYHRLRAEAEHYGERVRTYQVALGATPGRMRLNIARDDQTSSLKPVSQAGRQLFGQRMTTDHCVEVDVETIDRWRAINDVGTVDLLKLDLQGGEVDALRGGSRTLRSDVNLVLAEVHFLPAYDSIPPLRAMLALMSEHGFTLYGIYNIYYAPNGRAIQGDGLWVSSRFDAALEDASLC